MYIHIAVSYRSDETAIRICILKNIQFLYRDIDNETRKDPVSVVYSTS